MLLDLSGMDSMDILSLRAEALPEGLPGEQVYSLLFAPIEEEGPTDLMDMRQQAWQEGRIMRKSSGERAGRRRPGERR